MGTFVCDECGVLENTALGWWHSRSQSEKYIGFPNGTALCSQCTPPYFLSGEKLTDGGEWHNRFPRRYYKDNPEVPVLNRPKIYQKE